MVILHFCNKGFRWHLKAFLHRNDNKQTTDQKFKCMCNSFALCKAKWVIQKVSVFIKQFINHKTKCCKKVERKLQL